MSLVPALVAQLLAAAETSAREVKKAPPRVKPTVPVEVQLERVIGVMVKPMTQREIRALLSITNPSAYKYLCALRELGRVQSRQRRIFGRLELLWEKT